MNGKKKKPLLKAAIHMELFTQAEEVDREEPL